MKKDGLFNQLERVNYLFPQIMRRIFIDVEKKASHHDVPFAQQRLLWVLSVYGNMGMKELAGRVSVTMPTMTEVVNHMVGQGYAQRYSHPKDRRRVMISITALGKKIMNECIKQREERFQIILKKLKLQDRKKLILSLETMNTILSHLGSSKETK
jgi:DNA-binding MarR family transcriptional regulator